MEKTKLDAHSIEIMVNGEPRTAVLGETVLDLLVQLNLDPERVAVEWNRQILRRPSWAETKLEHGARLEIVHFVGGG